MTPSLAVAADRRAPDGTALLVPLADATSPASAGGKASVLAHLIRLGFPVPDGVVLTVAASERFFAATIVGERIERMLGTLTPSSPLAELEQVAGHVRTAIAEASLPPEVEEAIDELPPWLLRDGRVVVRSSAIGEDGRASSFAGQFDSVLHVRTRDELRDAIRTCWASTFSARALFYCQSRGLARTGMAVLIQRQVPAAAAGVLFTHAPVMSGGADDLMVEYGSGLADGIVAGTVDPGRLLISRVDWRPQPLASASDEGTTALVTNNAASLGRLAVRLESALGGPQDVEWAIDADTHVWIVQSRPITTGGGVAPRPAPGSTCNGSSSPSRTTVWSNANVSENFPDPISPLLYSIASAGYYHYFRNLGLAFGVSRRRLAAMDDAFRAIVGVHGARLYYNLTNIHAVLRLAPFGTRLADAFNLFVGATDRTPAAGNVHAWTERGLLSQTFELARIALAVTWQFAFLERRLRSFEQTADAFAARTTDERLDSRALADLGRDLASFIDVRCNRWKNASLCDTAAMVCYAALGRTLHAGGFDTATQTRLLRAIPGVPSSQPALRLWDLSRLIRDDAALRRLFDESEPSTIRDELARRAEFASFRARFERYLADWGFRSSGELMLTHPSLEEAPEPAIALLTQYARTAGDPPAATIERQANERRIETRFVLTRMWRRPHLAAATWVLLRWTQRSVVARERARLKQALLYTRSRRVVLRIGRQLERQARLERADDVFMLTWQEIDEVCAGRFMFPGGLPQLVALRRNLHHAESAATHPDTIHVPEGGWLSSLADTRAAHAGSSQPDTPTSTSLEGAIACGGRVSARAAVLAGVQDSHWLTRGDILVTRQTDPGWAPVFCLVSGLVIERGGMLSHGAIIAREFGLPCVVGVAGATSRIPHGSHLTLDADRGRCLVEAGR